LCRLNCNGQGAFHLGRTKESQYTNVFTGPKPKAFQRVPNKKTPCYFRAGGNLKS
jgi:hypothetical protein